MSLAVLASLAMHWTYLPRLVLLSSKLVGDPTPVLVYGRV